MPGGGPHPSDLYNGPPPGVDDKKKRKREAPAQTYGGPANTSTSPTSYAQPSTGVTAVDIHKESGGQLPTSVSMAISNSGMPNDDLRRAARIAARYYDVSPQVIWGKTKMNDIQDPITGGPMRLSTWRRLTDGLEPTALYGLMIPSVASRPVEHHLAEGGKDVGHISQAKPQNVAGILEAIGKRFQTEDLKATDIIGVAMSLADEGINAKLLDRNLDAVDRWMATGKSATWQERMGIAIEATKAGKNLRDVTGVVEFTQPDFVRTRKEDLKRLEDLGYTPEQAIQGIRYSLARKQALDAGQAEPPLPAGMDPNLVGAARIAPSLGYTELFTQFEGTTEDYFKKAKELQDQMEMRAETSQNSWLNRNVVTPGMKVFSTANNAFEVMGVTIADAGSKLPGPLRTLTAYNNWVLSGGEDTPDLRSVTGDGLAVVNNPKATVDQYVEDVQAAWHGKLRMADVLVRDWAMPRWQAEAAEFGTGWYLDPLVIAGKGVGKVMLRGVHPQLLETIGKGEATAKKMATYEERIASFVDRNGDSFARAIRGTDEDVIKWTRSFRTEMGSAPFDTKYLLGVQKEVAAREAAWGRQITDEEIKQALTVHFGGAPEPGTLADFSYRARLKATEDARNMFRPGWDARKYNEGLIAQAAEDGELALTTEGQVSRLPARMTSEKAADSLPRSLEIPKRNMPIPGAGSKAYLGEKWADTLGETGFGQQLRKLPTINPGRLEVHGDPARWFRLSSRRAGLPESRVLEFETKAAEAAAGPAPELALKELAGSFQKEVQYSFTRPYNISDATADEMLKTLNNEALLRESTQSFGTKGAETITIDGQSFSRSGVLPASVQRPLSSPQLLQEVQTMDPVIMKRAVNEYVGMMRQMRANILRMAGKADALPEIVQASRIPFRRWLDLGVRGIYGPMVRLFKFSAVARPAYISRVILGDELARSLATTQSAWEIALSYGIHARALDAPLPEAVARGIEGLGERRIAGEVIPGPSLTREGALAEGESFAKTYRDYSELTADSMKMIKRRQAALEASGDWTLLDPGKVGHEQAWLHALNNTVPQEGSSLNEAMKAIANGSASSLEGLKNHMRYWAKSRAGNAERLRVGWSREATDEWADLAAEQSWNLAAYGNRDIARLSLAGAVDESHLAQFPKTAWVKDGKVYAKEADAPEGAMEVWARPHVNGPLMQKVSRGPGQGRWMNRWYKTWVSAPENVLNRVPYYRVWGTRAKAAYTKTLTDAGIEITPELRSQIDAMARDFAVGHNKRIMFDFTENARYGEMLSPVFPFMQPFLENIAVWGHILTKRNPALIGYVNRLSQLGVESGFIKKDPDTGEWTVPETWFTATVPVLWAIAGRSDEGGPASMFSDKNRMFSLSTRATSLNMFVSSSIDVAGMPIPAPSASPWIQWPLQKALDDKTLPPNIESYLFNYGPGAPTPQEAMFEMFVPRYVRMALQGWAPDVFGNEQVDSLSVDFLRMQQRLGYKVDPGLAKAQAQQAMYYMAFTAAFFPGAVSVKFPQDELETLYHQKAAEFGTNQSPDYDRARDWFLKHYPKYDLITIPKTMNAKVSNWVDENGTPMLKTAEGVNPAPTSIRLPATSYFNELLKTPGFKEFAQDPETAAWAWLFTLRGSDPNQKIQIDPTAFAQQMSRGDVRYRTATEVYADHQEYKFFSAWDPIDKQYDRQFKALDKEGVDSTDAPYKELSRQRNIELEELAKRFDTVDSKYLQPAEGGGYQFVYESDGAWPEGVHPAILHQAVVVMHSKVAQDFPATQGLKDYWKLRTDIRNRLVNRGLDGLESDGAGQLKKEYEQGVKEILNRTPEFEVGYDTWFSHDLGAGLPTKGQVIIRRWQDKAAELGPDDPKAQKLTEKYDSFMDFTTHLEGFNNEVNDLEAQGKGSQAGISSVYNRRTQYINDVLDSHPEFADIYQKYYSAGSRRQMFQGVYTRTPAFYSRMDWDYLGVKMSNKAIDWLEKVQTESLDIQKWDERTDLMNATGDRRTALNQFIKSHLGKDPTFDKAIDAMNTWGWGAIAAGYAPAPGEKPQGRDQKAWKALLDYANEIKQVAWDNHIHGDDSRVNFDPKDIGWYNNYRDNLGQYVDTLRKWSPMFAQQWGKLSETYDGKLIYWLMPEVTFKQGDTNPYG